MNQETVRSILLRAEEIDRDSKIDPHSDPKYADLISAAAEAGINKDSVIQALRERLAILSCEPVVGDMVFALSIDGDYHLAKLVGESGEYSVVEFYGGGTANVLSSMVKPFQMIPGSEVNVNWNGRGWVFGKVIDIDREKNWLYVEFGKETQYFAFDEVRLLKATPIPRWPIISYLGAKIFLMLGSGAIGAFLMWLFQRLW